MKALVTILLAAAFLLPGCNTTHTVKMEPVKVEVEPIHMTLDINVKVDKQLDDFFDFEDEFEEGGE
jgi:hypothetical protein